VGVARFFLDPLSRVLRSTSIPFAVVRFAALHEEAVSDTGQQDEARRWLETRIASDEVLDELYEGPIVRELGVGADTVRRLFEKRRQIVALARELV